MAEWPNVPDSKSGVPQGTVGSNPTLSAIIAQRSSSHVSLDQAAAVSNLTFPELIASPKSANRLQRCDWLEMQLAQNFMQDPRLSMLASLSVVWITAVILFSSV